MNVEQLLVDLHAVGTELAVSPNVVYRHWGLHLLEDYKSLLLMSVKLQERTCQPA